METFIFEKVCEIMHFKVIPLALLASTVFLLTVDAYSLNFPQARDLYGYRSLPLIYVVENNNQPEVEESQVDRTKREEITDTNSETNIRKPLIFKRETNIRKPLIFKREVNYRKPLMFKREVNYRKPLMFKRDVNYRKPLLFKRHINDIESKQFHRKSRILNY